MARSITLTLGVGLGADLGPNFNLTADVGSVTPSTATKIQLLSPGKVVSVDDLATQVTVTSTGTCTNSITQNIPCASATTSTSTTSTTSTSTTSTTTSAGGGTTSTTTTTTAASTNFLISDGSPALEGCNGLGGPWPNSVYAASSVWYDPGGPYVTRFFTNSSMTTGFNGGSLYYGDQYSTFGTTLQIDNDGYVIGYISC
jgi:hypothetical protein